MDYLYTVLQVLGPIAFLIGYFVLRNHYVYKERARMLDHIYLVDITLRSSYLNVFSTVSFTHMLLTKWYVWPLSKLWPSQFNRFSK